MGRLDELLDVKYKVTFTGLSREATVIVTTVVFINVERNLTLLVDDLKLDLKAGEQLRL